MEGVAVERVSTRTLPGAVLWVRRGQAGYVLGLGLNCPVDVLVAAQLIWPSGEVLLKSGPYELDLPDGDAVQSLAVLLVTEVERPRCGAVSLLSSYVEVLLVHLMRAVIAGSKNTPGLLGGLADPRLARALVSLHDRPARRWTTDMLADAAGMSRSSFMARFRDVVGVPPMAYLRQWRLTLAQGDLARGDRVTEVARRYGYGSSDAFSRAFQSQFGAGPSEWRKSGALAA